MCRQQGWEYEIPRDEDFMESSTILNDRNQQRETMWEARMAILEARIALVEARVERLETGILVLRKSMRLIFVMLLVTLVYAIFK